MTELLMAAEQLEQKVYPDLQMPPFERYTGEVWRSICGQIPEYCPPWYRALVSEYRIAGAYFQYPFSVSPHYGPCTIARPSTALYWIFQTWPLPQLFEYGFSCFADGEDGNVWMFETAAGPDPEVFFLYRTAWGGGKPDLEHGLICPGIKMSELFRHAVMWTEKG